MQNRSEFEPITSPEIPKDSVVLHADSIWYNHVGSGHCGFVEKLGKKAKSAGFRAFYVHSDDPLSLSLLDNAHLHVMLGPKRHRGPHIFHAHPSYIKGFWYLDPRGYFWNSSLVDAEFQPDSIPIADAKRFFDGVSRHKLRQNVSKRPQVNRMQEPLAPAGATVFVQDIEKYKKRAYYLKTRKIIEQTARTVRGLLYVKLHPILRPEIAEAIQEQCSALENTRIIEASVHDLIAASDVVISQNSAVGFEALMHKKPIITCAKCDYHHASLVSHNGRQLRDNIAKASEHFREFPYEKYFYWFMGMNMLEPNREDFSERAFAILTADWE